MAGISATCSTGSLLRKTGSSHTGVAKFPYNGLGAVERNQLNAGVSKPDGFSSALGIKKTREIKAVATPTVSAPKRENDPKKRVAITGMGLVSVFGSDIDAFYDKLLQGKSGITPIDRFDASNFPVWFAGQIHDFSSNGYIDDKIDRRLDDSWRYCIVAGRKALDDANLGPKVLKTVSERAIEALQFNG